MQHLPIACLFVADAGCRGRPCGVFSSSQPTAKTPDSGVPHCARLLELIHLTGISCGIQRRSRSDMCTCTLHLSSRSSASDAAASRAKTSPPEQDALACNSMAWPIVMWGLWASDASSWAAKPTSKGTGQDRTEHVPGALSACSADPRHCPGTRGECVVCPHCCDCIEGGRGE